jgi:TonB family protein
MFRRLLPCVALLCAIPIPLVAQSSTDALRSRLINRPLYLRGLWQEDGLHFDPAGNLIGTSHTLPFTLCGIEIKAVELKPKSLLLEGRRVGIEFDNNTPHRIVIVTGSPQHSGFDEEMRVEIDAPPNGDYTAALDAIFTDDLASFVPSLRFAWQLYATRHFLHGPPPPDPNPDQPAAPPAEPKLDPWTPPASAKGAGGDTPAHLIKSVPPQYNQYARVNRIAGNCLISLVVGRDGKPSHVNIMRPIGFGLDEEALRVVEQSVFTPAIVDGQPALSEMSFTINFDLR